MYELCLSRMSLPGMRSSSWVDLAQGYEECCEDAGISTIARKFRFGHISQWIIKSAFQLNVRSRSTKAELGPETRFVNSPSTTLTWFCPIATSPRQLSEMQIKAVEGRGIVGVGVLMKRETGLRGPMKLTSWERLGRPSYQIRSLVPSFSCLLDQPAQFSSCIEVSFWRDPWRAF